MQLEVLVDLPRQRRSVSAVRRIVASALAELGVRADDRHDLVTALSEACTNAVQHAEEGRRYQVAFLLDGAEARIEVHDDGRGFFVNGHRSMPRPEQEGGRGIALMDRLVDAARFSHSEDGSTVVLRRRITAEAESLLHQDLAGPPTPDG